MAQAVRRADHARSEAELTHELLVHQIELEMQNEQLPQLLDSIRDQVGSEQADGFKASVGTTLDTLMDQLQTARDGVNKGVQILSGEEMAEPMALGTEEPTAELPEPTTDLDQDETDGFNATDAAVGGEEELGRELR